MVKEKTHPEVEDVFIVNRVKEIDLFEREYIKLRNKHEAFKSIIDFWGIPGIGKSTLLREIQKICLLRNNKTVYLDFKEVLSKGKRLSGLELLELINRELLINMFGDQSPKNITTGNLSQEEKFGVVASKLLTESQKYLSLDDGHLVVFLFDSVEYCRPEVFQLMERTLFSPLVSTKKVMIILASQSRKNWGMLDVRQRTLEYKIQPFDLNSSWKQISYKDKVDIELARVIYDVTFGVPACNQLVYNAIKGQSKKKNQSALLSKVNKAGLLHSEMEYFFGQTVKKLNSELKFALRVISNLKWFDYALLRELLVSIDSVKYDQIKASKFRDITRQLEETNYINWDIKNRGFAMDFTLRKIISLDLRFNNYDVFLTIKNVVIKWFKKLAEEYDPSFLYFLDLIYYRALFEDLEPVVAEVDEAIDTIEKSGSTYLEKIMLLEQILRTLNESEYREIVPSSYIVVIQNKSTAAIEKLLSRDEIN